MCQNETDLFVYGMTALLLFRFLLRLLGRLCERCTLVVYGLHGLCEMLKLAEMGSGLQGFLWPRAAIFSSRNLNAFIIQLFIV